MLTVHKTPYFFTCGKQLSFLGVRFMTGSALGDTAVGQQFLQYPDVPLNKGAFQWKN